MYKVFSYILFVCLSISTIRAQQKEYSLLFLGDVYTKGISAEENYPARLIKELRKEGLYIKSSKILAEPDWTSSQLMDALLNDEDYSKYDYVFLCIGANNIIKNNEINVYKKDIVTLMNYASMFSANKPANVFVISIPDYGFSPAYADKKDKISPLVDVYNNINKEEANKAGTNYINITNVSRISNQVLEKDNGQYALWANEIVPVLVKSLKGK